MFAFRDAVTAALIHSLWQDALVGLVAGLGLAVLGHRLSAPTRYAVSCLALAVMALLPVGTVLNVYGRPSCGRASISNRVSVPRLPVASTTAATPTRASVSTLPMARPSQSNPSLPDADTLGRLEAWALPCWLAGVLLCSLRLIAAGAAMRRLGRHTVPADGTIQRMAARVAQRIGLNHVVRVLVSSRADGPVTFGWMRPVILFPAAALICVTPQQLEALLAHELAHIWRRDYLVNALQMVAETLFFYHPAVWWMSRRIRIEREYCCDDLAVRTCGDPVEYAHALTRVAGLHVSKPAVASSGGSLLRRIERVLDMPPSLECARPISAALGIAAMVLFAITGQLLTAAAQAPHVFAGVIRGQVVDDATGAPIPGALVDVFLGGRTLTHADGTFEVRNVSPGDHLVNASARGYLRTFFSRTSPGQRDDEGAVFAGPERPVHVRDGERISDIDIRLVRTSSVSGQVYSDTGIPMSGVEVELLQRSHDSGAVKAIGFSQTEGQPAVYQLRDVPPGEYYVRAYVPASTALPRGDGRAYAPTFFPRALARDAAQTIVVSAGRELPHVDLSLAVVPTRRVSGQLSTIDGASLAGASVELARIGGSSEARPHADVRPDGRFSMSGVMDGDYVLRVDNERTPSAWTGTRRLMRVDADVDDLQIVYTAPAHINGRFVLASGRAIDFDPGPIDVAIEYGGGVGPTDMDASTPVRRDGTFAVDVPAGAAIPRITTRAIPRPFRMPIAMILDGRQMAIGSLPLTAGRRHQLTLVFADLSSFQAQQTAPTVPLPEFDVASVKRNTLGEQPSNNWRLTPGRVDYHNSQIIQLLKAAWGDFSLRVEGGPGWITSDRFDVVVQYPVNTPSATATLMLRALLIDRFKLAAHLEERQVPMYSLVVARTDGRLGPKLQPGAPECAPTERAANPTPECLTVARGIVQLGYRDMTYFTRVLSSMPAVGRPVMDKTGLTGNYKVELKFNPAAQALAAPPPANGAAATPPSDSDLPSVFTAIQEQLGLKLEDARGPVPVLIVDRIEPPTPD